MGIVGDRPQLHNDRRISERGHSRGAERPGTRYNVNVVPKGTSLPANERANIISTDNPNGEFLLKLMSALKSDNNRPGIDTLKLEIPKSTDSDEVKAQKLANNTKKVKEYFADSEFTRTDNPEALSHFTGKGAEGAALTAAFTAAAKKAGITDTKTYVSETINNSLENKCATANAVNYYLEGTPEERTKRIADYLEGTGRFKDKTDENGKVTSAEEQIQAKAKSVEGQLNNFLLSTGVISFEGKSEAEVEQGLRDELAKHKGKGVVLQLAESAAGKGTAVLFPEHDKEEKSLETWLNSDKSLIDRLCEHSNFKHMKREDIVKEFTNPTGVSWQAMSDIKDEGSIIFDNKGPEAGLVPTMASIQVADDGVHKGNKMIEPKTLEGYSDDLGLISELILDRQLKDAKMEDGSDRFPKGMAGVFDGDESYEMAIAGADLFITKDGKLQISEYNIRPTGSTKAHDSSLYHEEEPIYPRDSAIMKPNGFSLSKELVDTIKAEGDIGHQAYAELVKEKTDPILMRGATLETETGEILRPSIDGGGTFYTDATDQTEENFIKMFPTVFFPAIKAVDNVVEKAVEEAVTVEKPEPKNIFQKEETAETPEAPEAPRELAHEQAIANEIGEAMASITPEEVKSKAAKIKLRNARAEQRAARTEAIEASTIAAETATGAQHGHSFSPLGSQDQDAA